MSANNLPVLLREVRKEDGTFIHNSWLESSWYRNKRVPNAKRLMSNRIVKVMEHSKILVACDPEDDEIIYGYVLYEDDAVHWVYVKYLFRKQGLATLLLSAIPQDALKWHTFLSPAGETLIKKYNSQLTPFIYERWEK